MALLIGSSCTQPTLTAVGACVPYRTLKIKKFILIKSSIIAADAANLYTVGLGGIATAPDVVTQLNAWAAASPALVVGTPAIGGFAVAAPSITTLTDVNACTTVDIITGQEASFKSAQASTASSAVFTTGTGALNAFQEWDFWNKVSSATGCWSGSVMLVDCDLNLYYLLSAKINCNTLKGAAAFADITLTANMETDATTGVVTWNGKISNTTGFILQPILNLSSTGVTPNPTLI